MYQQVRNISKWLLLLCFITACGGDKPTLPKLSSDAVILAYGDSLTRGYGADEQESYPAILQQLSGRKVVNAGVSGEETAAGLERLPSVLSKHKPQLLILCHGGNDMLRKRSMEAMEANIHAMIALAKQENIPVVLLGVPQPGILLSAAKVYTQIADGAGVLLIENVIATVLRDNGLKSDTIHPNKKGYQVIAETIYTELKAMGAL